MNIGRYKPDGNIMSVPEIKEIVTEGVDISDLKDKVDTIQGNVTTLQEAISDTNEALSSTITDLNNTKGNVETLTTAVNTLDTELSETAESVATNTEDIATNATDIATLQGVVQSLRTEINTLRGAVLLENEYTYNAPIFWGYVAGNKTCYTNYNIPKILDPTKNYEVNYSGVTSINMRAGSVVKSFTSAEEIAQIINTAYVRNGNIQINFNEVSAFTAYETLTVVFNGALKVKVSQ